MDATFFRFDVHGEPDNRRFELSIGVDEMPTVLTQTGSNSGHYLDQVEFYLYEPEGTDLGYSFLITLHERINPGYDRAVQLLLGRRLSDVVQNTGSDADLSARDAVMSNRGEETTHEAVLEEFLRLRTDETKASQIIGRILANSTFLA